MFKRYKRIFVLSPTMLTGGPEALHQFAQFANELGIETRVAYYGVDSTVRLSGRSLTIMSSANNPCLAGYAKYNPLPATGEHQLDDQTLVVLPEVIAWHAHRFRPADVAVWWLSVDNGIHERGPLHDVEKSRPFFADRSIYHLCQTAYSADLLRSRGVAHTYDLVDYTDDAFTLQPPEGPNVGSAMAYNPRKGAQLAEAFFSANPQFESQQIQGMAKPQIAEIFRKTQIYIEFGHNPGKDRMPREAACAGCIVVARRAGGTNFFGDVPLPDKFKFSDEDVGSGRLANLIHTIVSDPQPFWHEQSYYRRYLYTEKDLMRLQMRRLLGLT